MRPVIAGAAVGLLAAIAGGRSLQALLFHVTPGDVPTFVSVSGAIIGSALVACLIPAARAARIDPSITLRGEY
jgi:ABC-type lipoprotein release transport system permease subunit